jgi:hypothetical protein
MKIVILCRGLGTPSDREPLQAEREGGRAPLKVWA